MINEAEIKRRFKNLISTTQLLKRIAQYGYQGDYTEQALYQLLDKYGIKPKTKRRGKSYFNKKNACTCIERHIFELKELAERLSQQNSPQEEPEWNVGYGRNDMSVASRECLANDDVFGADENELYRTDENKFNFKNIVMEAISEITNKKKINEARLEGFRVDVLTNSKTFEERIEYCVKMLGNPIGTGSSRMVFQLDDNSVLKLAINDKGIGQNKEEIALGSNTEFSCFPKILNGTDVNNGLWIISEYVLTATKYDFTNVMKIPFLHIRDFVLAVKFSEDSERSKELLNRFYNAYRRKPDVINLFNDISKLYFKYRNEILDLAKMPNWGLCNRNGKATLVILDIGFSIDVKNNLYGFTN